MTAGRLGLELTILCKASDWQLSSLTQVCDSPFLSLFNLERLEIRETSYSDHIGKRCGEHPMAGTSTPIYHREKFIPIQGIYTTRRACLARALWGKNNGGVTRATKYFLTGVLAIGTCQGRPLRSFSLRGSSPVTLWL
jgi:hypothetical protein